MTKKRKQKDKAMMRVERDASNGAVHFSSHGHSRDDEVISIRLETSLFDKGEE